jgi:hypothetical protein
MLKKHFTNKIKSLLEFNHIRVQKLLEMSQDTLVTFLVSLLAATLFNKMSFNLNISEENSITFAKLLIELIFLIIVLYYVRKIIMTVPFFFRYTKNYIPGRPSSDGEGLLGKVVTMAIVFGSILVKLKEKIKHVSALI